MVIDASVLIKGLRVDDLVRKHDQEQSPKDPQNHGQTTQMEGGQAPPGDSANGSVAPSAVKPSLIDGRIELFTVPEVLQEVRNHFARHQLQFTPYEFTVREPSGDFMRLAVDFAKATGDFISLSTNDLKVIALTCQLEWELAGRKVDSAPPRPVILQGRPPAAATNTAGEPSTLPPQKLPEGFYFPASDQPQPHDSSSPHPKVNSHEKEEIPLSPSTAAKV